MMARDSSCVDIPSDRPKLYQNPSQGSSSSNSEEAGAGYQPGLQPCPHFPVAPDLVGARGFPIVVSSTETETSVEQKPSGNRVSGSARTSAVRKTLAVRMPMQWQDPFWTCSFVCLLLFFGFALVLGAVSASYYVTRNSEWDPSRCTVCSVTEPKASTTNYDSASVQVSWNVSYWNTVAMRRLTGILSEYYDNMQEAGAAVQTYYNAVNNTSVCLASDNDSVMVASPVSDAANNNYTCYYHKSDFVLAWELPHEDYAPVGWTAVAFTVAALLLLSSMLFIALVPV